MSEIIHSCLWHDIVDEVSGREAEDTCWITPDIAIKSARKYALEHKVDLGNVLNWLLDEDAAGQADGMRLHAGVKRFMKINNIKILTRNK